MVAASIGDDHLSALLGIEPTPVGALLETAGVTSVIRTASLDPQEALAAYLDENGLSNLGKRMSRSGMLELVATSTPGIKELLILGRLRQLEQSAHSDLVIADCPAAGHAMALLRSPASMSSVARSGRLQQQAAQALEMLADATRTQVVLVTLPEHTPVMETIEAAFGIEDEVGAKLGPILVNRCAPAAPPCQPPTATLAPGLPNGVGALVDRALEEDHARHGAEGSTIAELDRSLGIPHLELPDLSTPSGGVDLESLVAVLGKRA